MMGQSAQTPPLSTLAQRSGASSAAPLSRDSEEKQIATRDPANAVGFLHELQTRWRATRARFEEGGKRGDERLLSCDLMVRLVGALVDLVNVDASISEPQRGRIEHAVMTLAHTLLPELEAHLQQSRRKPQLRREIEGLITHHCLPLATFINSCRA